MGKVIIDLTVQNHLGVMSHIAGLFSRRAYNLEGILCSKLKDEKKSIHFSTYSNEYHSISSDYFAHIFLSTKKDKRFLYCKQWFSFRNQ